MNNILTVLQANLHIKKLIDNDFLLSNIFIKGEVSNYKKHTSGHHYLTLKDGESVINAVLFKQDALKISTKLFDGQKIIVYGRVSLFTKSGSYQVYIKDVQVDGIGDLHIAFEELKTKLYNEGLFDASNKKPLPRFANKIAIVTSKTGAVVSDMLKILGKRFPLTEVLVYPVKVQGEGAALEIANAINYINNLNLADIIIIGRGGGSIEDLWAFNDEGLAHTIYASNIPIISAVGHEPDVTISDFVADVRASTPSNAAEIAVADTVSVKMFLENVQTTLNTYISNKIATKRQALNSYKLKTPKNYIDEKKLYVDVLTQKLSNPNFKIASLRSNLDKLTLSLDTNFKKNIQQKRVKLIRFMTYIDGFSPIKVLARGYTCTYKGENTIKSIKDVKIDDILHTKIIDGFIESRIINIKD